MCHRTAYPRGRHVVGALCALPKDTSDRGRLAAGSQTLFQSEDQLCVGGAARR